MAPLDLIPMTQKATIQMTYDFRNLDKTFIIAEIGVNHEGDLAVAEDLVRKAAETGADAVKFQTFEIENYISTVQPERRDRTAGFQLSRDQFRSLATLAVELGLIFFSTPFHMNDADFLDEIAPIFKVSSGDLTYLELIRHVSAKKKPMIISTGIGTEQEIEAAIGAAKQGWPDITEAGGLLIMHCVATYPTTSENANVRNVSWLAERFGIPVGYSDHTLGTKACELAVAAGAAAIEKHFTYRKEDQAFHDHLLSANPEDMTLLVKTIREAEVYLGRFARERGEAEEEVLAHMRRSIGAVTDIPAGTEVRKEWLTYLRPQWGLLPDSMTRVAGKSLSRDIKAGDLISEEDLG